jgi:hypothetical protein
MQHANMEQLKMLLSRPGTLEDEDEEALNPGHVKLVICGDPKQVQAVGCGA